MFDFLVFNGTQLIEFNVFRLLFDGSAVVDIGLQLYNLVVMFIATPKTMIDYRFYLCLQTRFDEALWWCIDLESNIIWFYTIGVFFIASQLTNVIGGTFIIRMIRKSAQQLTKETYKLHMQLSVVLLIQHARGCLQSQDAEDCVQKREIERSLVGPAHVPLRLRRSSAHSPAPSPNRNIVLVADWLDGRQAVRDTRSLAVAARSLWRLSLRGPAAGLRAGRRSMGRARADEGSLYFSLLHAILCVLALKTASRVLKAGIVYPPGAVPFFCIFLPLSFFSTLFFFDGLNMELKERYGDGIYGVIPTMIKICLVLISFFPLINAVLNIVFVKPYRDFAKKLLSCIFCHFKENVVNVDVPLRSTTVSDVQVVNVSPA
ncbi:hypothetical protein Ddc_18061 [Ditylenchus destructor]|nr:hypothetical protein Ddc_18061 [Ditylenchus destructor]